MKTKTWFFKTMISLAAAFALIGLMAIGISAADTGYGYTKLTASQQKLYESIHTAATGDTPATLVTVSENLQLKYDDAVLVLAVYEADHPEVFWLGGNNISTSAATKNVESITMYYVLDEKEVDAAAIAAAKSALQTELDKIETEMAAAEVTNDEQKALWLHDKVAAHVTYTDTNNDQTAYGALVEGEAVCAGYARLYQLLLQENGIRAWTVTGDSVNPENGNTVPHAWTLMWLGENCLYTDVTWDDQGEDLYHVYYCRTLDAFDDSHVTDSKIQAFLPACTDACDGYLQFTDGQIVDIDITAKELAEILIEQDFEAVLYTESDQFIAKIKDTTFRNEVFYAVWEMDDTTYNINALGFDWVDGCGTEVHLRMYELMQVTGKVYCSGNPNEKAKLELFRINGETRILECIVDVNTDNTYSIYVEPGEYVLCVSKTNHVTREYPITVG